MELAITGQDGPLPCTIAGIGAGYVSATLFSSTVAMEIGATPPVGLLITPYPGRSAGLAADLEALDRAERGLWVTSMADIADVQRETVSLSAVTFNGLLVAPLISALAARLTLRTLRGPADAALEST